MFHRVIYNLPQKYFTKVNNYISILSAFPPYLINENHDITHYVRVGQHGIPERVAKVHEWRAILLEHRVVVLV